MTKNISIKQNKNIIEVIIGNRKFKFDNCYNINTFYTLLQNTIVAAYDQGQVDMGIDLVNIMAKEQAERNREPGE